MTAWLTLVMACGTPEAPAPKGQTVDEAVAKPVEGAAKPAEAARAGARELTPVRRNLNTASDSELGSIPGVTPALVHAFEEHRPYVSVTQFREEFGKDVPVEEVRAVERFVFVPIDPNRCDSPTLEQIEGIDAAIADELLGKRPYADRAAFEAELAKHLPPDAVRAALRLVTGL
ncbi:MAG: hypothetical protein AAF602_00640 [Myxococcota bacterium]